MSNSSLICYTNISPNKTSPRNHSIDTITVHCMAGNGSVETCGNIFASPARQASSNYGIGSDGRIGMYVEEKDRSWCSSNAANDHRAITIEVANDGGAPDWHVSDKAMTSLINLIADICKRNNIKKLVWSTNKEDRINHRNGCNMTVHRDFAAKACPGDYLYNKHSYIASEVNKMLATPVINPSNNTIEKLNLKDGDVITLVENAIYITGTPVPTFVLNSTLYYRGKSGTNVMFSTQKNGAITGTVNKSQIAFPRRVLITDDTYIREKGSLTAKKVLKIKKNDVYVVEAQKGNWYKLADGKGWIPVNKTKTY